MKLETKHDNLNGKRYPANEKDKQKLRKENNPSSRFLDNYFNPTLYEKVWWPNGLHKIKKEYSYSESGLCHFFEKNNTLQKRLVSEQEENKLKLKHYLEYDYIEENQYLITIEYCSNCLEHQTHTQHNPELFKNFAVNLQKCIALRFPFIKVLLKPIDTDIILEQNVANSILNKTKIIDHKYKEVRIGAMEIQMCFKKTGDTSVSSVLLHSKLFSGNWPSITNVLNSIVSYVPLITCDIKVYDKESKGVDEISEKNNKEMKGLLETKIEQIKLNVYRHKNSQIEELCNSTREELDNFIDPKKRKTILSTKKSLDSFFRIQTAKSKGGNTFNTFSQLSKELNSQKGELLITLYTDNNGVVTIKDVPYDSYLIEIEESANYQSSFLPVTFKSIENEKSIKKFIGLHKQNNSYVQVYVYYQNPSKKEDEMISDTDVIIHSAANTSEEKLLFEEQELKVKLKENKNVLGRYEAVVVPGKYTLSVNKKGFDLIRKMININSGENKINIELTKEQSYNIKVSVLNHSNMSPIENALIKLKYANEEDCYEGISNPTGFFSFNTPMKEDFVTIFVDKPGFLPAQRTYIRDVAGSGNEQESEVMTREIVVLLVKETLVTKENSIIMITYSNLNEENFEPVYLYSSNIGNYTDINCSDSQTENGILTSFFKYHPPKSEERNKLKDFEEEELEEIVRLMLKVSTKRLKKEYKFHHNLTLNGLQRFCCECCIYTPQNTFYINPPSFSRESRYDYWDIGFLDIKNNLFYEANLLTKTPFEKNLFFFDFTNFLQVIIDKKIYSKLFEMLDFDKGQFLNNDRFLYEPSFLRSLRNVTGDVFSADFLLYICDMMKSQNKMISYSIFKKKISSNLKNFREVMKLY